LYPGTSETSIDQRHPFSASPEAYSRLILFTKNRHASSPSFDVPSYSFNGPSLRREDIIPLSSLQVSSVGRSMRAITPYGEVSLTPTFELGRNNSTDHVHFTHSWFASTRGVWEMGQNALCWRTFQNPRGSVLADRRFATTLTFLFDRFVE